MTELLCSVLSQMYIVYIFQNSGRLTYDLVLIAVLVYKFHEKPK